MNIGFLCPHKQYQRRFQGLVQYLESKRHTIKQASNWLSGVGNYDIIFTWNGYTPKDYRLRRWAKVRNCRVAYIEVGYFSQKTHSIISTTIPIGGQFLKNVSIPILNQQQIDSLKQQHLIYSNNTPHTSSDYILVLFQLPKDRSIVKESKYKNMQQLVNKVEQLYPNDHIIYKTHPREEGRNVTTSFPVIRRGNLHELISKAKEVVAINSTGLFEAAFAGCPVRALGRSPFVTHEDNPLGVVYEVLQRQIPNNDPNIDSQIHRVFGDYFD